MKGDGSLFRHAKHPYLALLVVRILKTDPTMVLTNKRENPYPWIHVPQNQNLKLFAVANKFDEKGVRETFILNKEH
ncbi:hypothetical protein HDV03_001265 [Kappamyces sp. JEL0829]|nr:hypothetical protein HDV03_001265 [Kappamyces sp. JEL0829]